MFRRLLAYLLAFWAALAVFSPAFGAEPVFPPGLRIGLVPPGDLKPSTRFPGFEDIDRKVTVTIFDLPAGAYAELERAARAENQRDLIRLLGLLPPVRLAPDGESAAANASNGETGAPPGPPDRSRLS